MAENELKKIAGDVNPRAIPTEVITIAVNFEVSINFCHHTVKCITR
ncbi:class II lanthipeptide, LchA2/BrtA2 family [Bacillus toyonensis]|nr:class II lanthipeptide, LchA2/BrtA2 family [Bacillus toyonensis]